MREEYLRAAAEAFANLSDIESDCYHYLNNGFNPIIQDRLLVSYATKLSGTAIRKKYIDKVVRTALAECQYPVEDSTGYAWNDIERASFAGIAKQTWSDNKLSDHVNFILNDMAQIASTVRAKIQLQVAGHLEAS